MIYNRSLKDYYVSHRRDKDDLIPFLLGRNAINYLVESLSIKAIVLPSFICPMVIDIFKHHQVEIFYYEGLNKQLQVPVDDILTHLDGITSQDKLFFLWHDYLNIIGDMPSKLYDYLTKNNIESIVDATHSLPIKEYQSSIVVYGFRKLLNEPFGALLKLNAHKGISIKSPPFFRLWLFNLVYRIKATFLSVSRSFSNGPFNNLLKLISNVDQSFNFDSNGLFLYDNFKSNRIIDKHRSLNYQQICQNRQRNFHRYAKKIPNYLHLMQLDTSCPYGFPLMANNNALIRKKLWDQGIHSFILWNPLHNDVENNENKVSKYLSDSIVILPVNHDLDIKDIDRIAEVINE